MSDIINLNEALFHSDNEHRAKAMASLRGQGIEGLAGFARKEESATLVQLLRIGLTDEELKVVAAGLDERGIKLGEFLFLRDDFSYGNHNYSGSAFLVGVGTDCEEIGEYLWGEEDWGNIEPPGPNSGFGNITNEELEAHMDGVGASFSFQEIRDFGIERFFGSLSVDGFFIRVLYCTLEVESSYLAARVRAGEEGTLTITELEEG